MLGEKASIPIHGDAAVEKGVVIRIFKKLNS
jgi:hypothetical protein